MGSYPFTQSNTLLNGTIKKVKSVIPNNHQHLSCKFGAQEVLVTASELWLPGMSICYKNTTYVSIKPGYAIA